LLKSSPKFKSIRFKNCYNNYYSKVDAKLIRWLYFRFDKFQAPVSTNEVQRKIKEDLKKEISLTTVRRLLKYCYGLRYKKVYFREKSANSIEAKQKRQLASFYFAMQLSEGREIFNIDESSIELTCFLQKQWGKKGSQLYSKNSKRLNRVHIIAALSSKGRGFFAVGYGTNNGNSFWLFLLKLAAQLQRENQDWRHKAVFLIDNARYHRSKANLQRFQDFQFPVTFLGSLQLQERTSRAGLCAYEAARPQPAKQNLREPSTARQVLDLARRDSTEEVQGRQSS